MLNVIDIASHQGDIDLLPLTEVDAVIVKATGGTGYVNPYCDAKVQQTLKIGKKMGYYHFAGDSYPGTPEVECQFFIDNTRGYLHKGIPVLDWEGDQDVAWVNRWVRYFHDQTGIWPWIYANPWRFNQGGVEQNCGRWVAAYPNYNRPKFGTIPADECPDADGLICAWQFCSDGDVAGYNGNLDCSYFFGDRNAWDLYAGSKTVDTKPTEQKPNISKLENDKYVVTVQRK